MSISRIYQIKCHICQTVIGTIEYDQFQKTPNDGDFIDNRCEVCEASYGTYNELKEKAKKGGVSDEDFRTVLQKARKKRDFEKELKKYKSRN